MHCVLAVLIVNPVSHKAQFAAPFTGQWVSVGITPLLHMQTFATKP